MNDNLLIKQKREELELEERKLELRENLPHLYGWPFYTWSRQYFESTNRENVLCAANQISKSSTQIRKMIHWATEDTLWPKLWFRKPLQFWYLYPTFPVATVEMKTKWIPEFLPRGKFKDDPKYGWKAEYSNGLIRAIHFFSGVSCYFKAYAQDEQDLQTGSLDALFLDEECPESILAELFMRLVARRGYFHACFTPTLGEEYWTRVMEERGKPTELLPSAFKLQVSMFDCLKYEDGTDSLWTLQEIQRAILRCKSEAQVQRRIYGRCVADEGLKYPAFERTKNLVQPYKIPGDWIIVVGVDIGSGGTDGHPSAIVFVAVRPDYRKAAVFKGWRGDDVITTATDVALKVQELTAGLTISHIFYDHASADFYNIAQGMGLNVEPADKSHAVGEQVLNVLFKNQMLDIFDIVELSGLPTELTSLKKSTLKKHAKDDFIDGTRYGVTRLPWDFSFLNLPEPPTQAIQKTETEQRRDHYLGLGDQEIQDAYNEEIDALNELFTSDYAE